MIMNTNIHSIHYTKIYEYIDTERNADQVERKKNSTAYKSNTMKVLTD